MSNNQYFAKGTEDAFELERLGYLQQMGNAQTFRRLQAVGVGAGWRCLEVGAGEGAVARWLAERVGPTGQVVATDLNTRFLRDLTVPNIEVRTHHILQDDFEPVHYDLVHCRALLAHLPEPHNALQRMLAAVRPGGWLCIEEGDYGMWEAVPAGSAVGQRFTRSFRTVLARMAATGMFDPYFGRLTRSLLEGFNLADIGHDGSIAISHGNEPSAHFHRMVVAVLRQPLVAAGALTEEEVDALERAFTDPAFAFLGVTIFGAWGRRTG